MSIDVYHARVAALDRLEAEGGGVRKGWSAAQRATLRSSYDELLTQWPWLEGFWIRWAESEYKLGSAEHATAVYRRALHKQHLPHSVAIWVSYLSFLTHVCHPGPELPEYVRELYAEARQAIGAHFLSHEFWDLYLASLPDRIPTLLHILTDLTLHQYARYYAQLVEMLGSLTVPVSAFASIIPNEMVQALSGEEEQRLREVIHSRLKLQYELQTRRVNNAFSYEKQLRRPFFFPLPLSEQEREAWIAYIDSSPDPIPLYRRALIPGALDAGLWFRFLRYLQTHDAPAETILSTMEGAAATRNTGLILYYALWLERNNSSERASELYKSLLARPDADADVYVQYSQFLARRANKEVAKTELVRGFERTPSAVIIAEFAKFGHYALSDLSWPEDVESPELWKAKLAAFPDAADEIFEAAPENTIDEEYLAQVARTDAAKYLEVDRMIHRSAFSAH